MPAREKRMSDYLLRSALLALTIVLSVRSLQPTATYAADEPDLIFRRSTVFKLLTPNDKLATYGIDDPDVEGVACHFTVPERGGLTGWIGVAEEVSDISLACRQVGPIHFKKKFSQGEDMFRQRRFVLQENADRAWMRCQTQRSGLHAVFGQAHRGLAEKLDLLRSGNALGDRRTSGEMC
jgi:catabolite regulation protein CreA